jgi:hypothetical protein
MFLRDRSTKENATMDTTSEVTSQDGQGAERIGIDELVRAVEQVGAHAPGAATEMDLNRNAFQAWIREEDRRGTDFALCW